MAMRQCGAKAAVSTMNRHVQVQRQRPKPSAPAKLKGFTFQWERFAAIAKELPPLFEKHWREIALNQDKVPLDPDWARYYDYDLLGILQVLTVRFDGGLVGYLFVFVHPHLHYASTLWAQTDLYWINPAYRGRGVSLFRLMEKRLRELKVQAVYVNMKLHFEAERGTIAKIFERLGYKPIETIWVKWLGC
jgi:GNAT superfamily N-acetyltransferase